MNKKEITLIIEENRQEFWEEFENNPTKAIEVLFCKLDAATLGIEYYKSVLNNIQKMILSAWEQGKYLDGGLYECLTKEFSKINGI